MQTHREAIERVTIIGKIEDRDRARQYCNEKGFRIVHDTPRVISTNKVDSTSFRIIAEKPKEDIVA